MVRLADAIKRLELEKAENAHSDAVRKDEASGLRNQAAIRNGGTADRPRTSVQLSCPPEVLYERLVEFMEDVGTFVRTGNLFDIEQGIKLIRLIVNSPQEMIDNLHHYTLFSVRNATGALSIHSANVAINSIVMGRGLKYSAEEQLELGVAALFHEIGMHKVPDAIRTKKDRLLDEELQVLRSHPELSHQELLRHGEHYRWLADIVYQEHERTDGSGYPRGIRGDQIHEYASIIGLLDTYDALINHRPHRAGLLPGKAMKELVGACKELFPIRIIKILVDQWSIFPVNSYVKLNNNSIGMVVKANSLWPFKPTISLICDAQGRKVNDARTLDLAQNPLLYISDVIAEDEIPIAW